MDGALVADRSTLDAPFADPPADPNLDHSVPLDFAYPGVAIRRSPLAVRPVLARVLCAARDAIPRVVTIPDEPDVVIGAALLATGHDWDTDYDGDLDDVVDLLAPLRGVIRVSRRPPAIAAGQGGGRDGAIAGRRCETARQPSRFFLPGEGSALHVRSWASPSTRRTRSPRTRGWTTGSTRRSRRASEATLRLTPSAGGRRAPLVERSLLRDPRVCPPLPGRARHRSPTISARRAEAPRPDLGGAGPVTAPLVWLLLIALAVLASGEHRAGHLAGARPGRGHAPVRADRRRHASRCGIARAPPKAPRGGGGGRSAAATRRRATAARIRLASCAPEAGPLTLRCVHGARPALLRSPAA